VRTHPPLPDLSANKRHSRQIYEDTGEGFSCSCSQDKGNSEEGLNHRRISASLKGVVMKKHSAEPLFKPCDPEPSNIPAKHHVRYVGFEGTEGGRRLAFSVKSIGHESVEVTIKVSDGAFTGTTGISIQDAAPMAYEKIVELLAKEDTLKPNELCLTETDIARYIARHLNSQKRAHSVSDGRQQSDIAV
jgi:hypothetical protein